MAYLGQVYNEADLPGEDSFEPVPTGWYDAVIKEADIKDAKSGGKYINIQFVIEGPSHQGRVVFDMINFINKNPQTVEIAHKQLGSLIRAIGLVRVEDTNELVGGDCSIKVGLTKPTDEFPDPRNEVKGYKKREGIPSGLKAPKPMSTAATGPVIGNKSTPSWAKR
jgi:hypothetical protein